MLTFLILLGTGAVCWLILAFRNSYVGGFQKRLAGLGDLRGKSLQQITSVLGPGDSAMRYPDGRIVIEWFREEYHAALVFGPNGCEGLFEEIMRRGDTSMVGGVSVPMDFG